MRNTSKKLALSAIAAGAAALSAAGVAKADFVFNVVTSASTYIAGDTDYVLKAKNDGNNGTGTMLQSTDTTMTVISGGPMVVDWTHINPSTDTYASPLDADVVGAVTAFGAGSHGTFSGFGTWNVATVQENGVNDTNAVAWMTDPNKTGSATQTVPARYSTMTSLEVAGFATGGVPATSTLGANYANVLVPTADMVRVVVSAAGTTGNFYTATFTLGTSVGPTTTPIISLTTSAPAGYGSALAGLTVTGSNGKYMPAIIAAGGQAGYSQVSGFSPSTDSPEIFLLKLSSAADDATIIADINTQNNVTGLVASAPAGAFTNMMGIAWDVELTVTNPGALGNGIIGFNLANAAGISETVSQVLAVPEPATLGLLALGGIGLLARRRRA